MPKDRFIAKYRIKRDRIELFGSREILTLDLIIFSADEKYYFDGIFGLNTYISSSIILEY